MHNRVDILRIEVRPCSNGIEANDDGFSGYIGERLHLVLSISRSGSHLFTQHVIALFFVNKSQILVRNIGRRIIADLFWDVKIRFCGKSSFASE